MALLDAGVPVLDMLEPGLRRRPVNPLHRGAENFDRIENTRLARYARDYLLNARPPEPDGIATLLQKDLELAKLRLVECREPRDQDVWLHGLLDIARLVNPYLPPEEAAAVWTRFQSSACYGTLREFQRRWIDLLRRWARATRRAWRRCRANCSRRRRSAARRANTSSSPAWRATCAAGQPGEARALWLRHESGLRNRDRPLLRLLRCHAEAGDLRACAAAFAAYAE